MADTQYLIDLAEHAEGGVCGPNQTQRESKADNEWLASTLLPGESNPMGYQHQILTAGD
jgi:hypothetical protein